MSDVSEAALEESKKRGYKDILYEVKDQVAWVTINRPRVLNAFREQTLDELIDAFKSTREDPSIACAVVTGAGDKAFSAGGDFYAMKRLNWTNAAMWNDRMQGLAMTIRGLPIPVIAMVNGWCMGGGHELALWCDLVIASENAVLGQTGAKVGACPTVGATQYLPRIIGERLAREMIFWPAASRPRRRRRSASSTNAWRRRICSRKRWPGARPSRAIARRPCA